MPGDKDARLGVSIHFPSPFKKKIHYFWGYRNHIITDLHSELPIVEITLQANKDEKKVALPMLNRLHQELSLPTEVVTGDANYDVEAILRYVIEEMKAEAMIPKNPRNNQNTPYTVKRNVIYCEADLTMHRKGKMTTKGITYLQYNLFRKGELKNYETKNKTKSNEEIPVILSASVVRNKKGQNRGIVAVIRDIT